MNKKLITFEIQQFDIILVYNLKVYLNA